MWTLDELKSESVVYTGTVWRAVEQQSKAATVRITDTLDEQSLLEQIIDDVKPSPPTEVAGYHFLISTPFRYSPSPHGSRFRKPGQPDGTYYAAEMASTAMAEMAFYRLLFFSESASAEMPGSSKEYTAFSVDVSAPSAIDLTTPPINRFAEQWKQLVDYSPCQSLADGARACGIDVIRSQSVRDPDGGANITVLRINAIESAEPTDTQTWHIFLRPHAIQIWCENPQARYDYPIDWFAADPRIRTDSLTLA